LKKFQIESSGSSNFKESNVIWYFPSMETSHLVDEYNRLNRGKSYQTKSLPESTSPITQPVITQQATINGKQNNHALAGEVQNQVRQILAQNYQIGIEHVDERRFRTGSWQGCGKIHIDAESDAISTLESCLAEYSGEYIRLVGIDPKAKRRIVETIIQRPGKQL